MEHKMTLRAYGDVSIQLECECGFVKDEGREPSVEKVNESKETHLNWVATRGIIYEYPPELQLKELNLIRCTKCNVYIFSYQAASHSWLIHETRDFRIPR